MPMKMLGLLELLLLAGIAVAAFVLLRHFARRGAQPSLPSAFPVISLADGPGSYKVCGVDKATRHRASITA